jgi:hypothetical protein
MSQSKRCYKVWEKNLKARVGVTGKESDNFKRIHQLNTFIWIPYFLIFR